MAARPNIAKPPAAPPSPSVDPDEEFKREYVDYLVVDISQLDVELAQQSEIFYRVGERYILAEEDSDMAKNKLEETLNTVGLEVRERLEADAAASSGKAPTEGKIKANVMTDARVIEAQGVYNRARRRSASLKLLERCFDNRSTMLRKLTDLYAANWYSDTEGRATKQQLVEAAAKANKRLLSTIRDQEGYSPRRRS